MLVGVLSCAEAGEFAEPSDSLSLAEGKPDSAHHHHHHHKSHHHHNKKQVASYVIVKPDDSVKIFKKAKKGYTSVRGGKMTKGDLAAIHRAEKKVTEARP